MKADININLLPTAEQMKIETLENLTRLENEEIFNVLQTIKKASMRGEFQCYWGEMHSKTKQILISLGYKVIPSFPYDDVYEEERQLETKETEIIPYDISWK